jgi:hypothetical protein
MTTAGTQSSSTAPTTSAGTRRPSGRAPGAAADKAPGACAVSPWQLTVDERVTAVCAALLGTPLTDDPVLGWPAAAILSATAKVLACQGLPGGTGRYNGARQSMACYAAVYGRHFLPSYPWTTADAPVGSVLRWQHRNGQWLLDAPRATHADAPLVTDTTRDLAGTHRQDSQFLGIRLLALAAPLASRLLLPNGQLTALPHLNDLPLALAIAG